MNKEDAVIIITCIVIAIATFFLEKHITGYYPWEYPRTTIGETK